MPVFSSSLVYKEWARVLCERSFNLNASNSKKLVFGLSPFQLTSNVRKSDPEINVDFDFVLKIVDVKYGSSVSIFGNEIESFLSKIVKLKSAPKPNVGNVLISTKYYDMRQSGDSYYEFFDKNGRKIFKIFSESVHHMPDFLFQIEMMTKELSNVHWLRYFVSIVDRYINYQYSYNDIKSGNDVLACIHIINDVMDEKEKMNYMEIIIVFHNLIYEMVIHCRNNLV